jgi:hypothetical protein
VVEYYTAPDSADSFNFEVRIMGGVTAYLDDFHFIEIDTTPPSISATPKSMSFSAIVGDAVSRSVEVVTVNISENLLVSVIGNDADYFIASAAAESGAGKTLSVTYAPNSAGSHSATLTIIGGGIFCQVPLAGVANDTSPSSIVITPISSICTNADTSPYSGQRVTIAGVVTAITRSKSFFVQSGSGAQSGIYVYRRGNLVRVGDSVLVTGWVNETHGLTEIMVTHDADVTVVPGRHALPSPTPVTIGRMGKAYHGVLLRLDSVEVSAHATHPDRYMVGSGGGALSVAQDIAVTQPPAGAVVNLTGIGFCYDEHQLLPRSVSDVEVIKDVSPATAVPKPDERGAAIYPNPAGSFLRIESPHSVAKVEVYTLSGVPVLREKSVTVVNISPLQPGVYVVRVNFVSGMSLAKIIVKK